MVRLTIDIDKFFVAIRPDEEGEPCGHAVEIAS